MPASVGRLKQKTLPEKIIFQAAFSFLPNIRFDFAFQNGVFAQFKFGRFAHFQFNRVVFQQQQHQFIQQRNRNQID